MQACRFPVGEIETIIRELLEKMEGVIEQAATELPTVFPDEVARSIFEGMKIARDRLFL